MKIISAVCAIFIGVFTTPLALAEEPAPVLEVLGDIMTSDGGVTPDEKIFLQSWLDLQSPASRDLDGHSYNLAPLSEDDRELVAFIHAPVNLNDLWLTDQDKMRLFVRAGQISLGAEKRLIHFAASKFYAEWQNSNIGNGYGPIRDKVIKYYTFTQGLDTAEEYEGRRIGYLAMLKVNEAANNEVPMFIYSWMKPPEREQPPVDVNQAMQDWVSPEN